MPSILVFDIETVPDIETGRRLHGLDSVSEQEVADALFHQRRLQTGGASDFLKLPLHRVIVISVLLRNREGLCLRSLGEESAVEADLLREFFDHIDGSAPTLVSWNGRGFDLPVLHYRALLHGISSELYWESGDRRQDFRWNNYQSRFHQRHTDLMDVLAGYDSRSGASMNEVSRLLNLPGKLGMEGSAVWPAWQRGEISAIRDYCEIDVLNTYLIYLRYQLIRSRCSREHYEEEVERVREFLQGAEQEHLRRFHEEWQAAQ